MKNKIFLILFAIQFSICLNTFCQYNWNWVGQNNDFAVTNQVVKNFNDTIYTNGLSVYYGDSIPYVSLQEFKFDLQGNLISDTLLGNIDTTFVIGNNCKFTNNTFCTYGEVRYPRQPTKLYDQFAYFIDLNNKKHYRFIFTNDSISENYVKLALRLYENRFCVLIQSTTGSQNPTTICKLLVLDSLQNVIYQKNYSETGFWYLPNDMKFFENNYFLVINKMLMNNIQNPSNLVIIKLDTLFNPIHTFKTTTNNWYFANSSQFFPNGDFIIGGVYSDAWEPDGDVWQKKYLRRFDKNLNIIWTKYFGIRNLNTGITKLLITSDGNIAGCGIDGLKSDTVGIHITGCIFKFTADGDSIWMKNYQAIDDPVNGDNNELLDLDEMPDGGFVACGKAVAFSPYRQRGWLMRVDANGCLTPECLNSTKEVDEPSQFLTYPNPTNDILNITNPHQISTYQIYQLDGKLITQGNNFPIDISKFTIGIYFLKIATKNNQIINQKIIKQ
jgi:hypothetical protein